jgi:SAM-dependent methyltransferase
LTDPRLKEYKIGTKAWFEAQKRMIKAKPLIRACYNLWYRKLIEDAESVPDQNRKLTIVELGSGSSYIKELIPEIVTSDVSAGIADLVIDGRCLPFEDGSVKAILLTHVFHHIPDVSLFLKEASRVLVTGGVISIVECTHTPFGRFFFSKIHPEPYNDKIAEWAFAQGDSMLDSNQALSWIVFSRDRERFDHDFPSLFIEKCTYLPWLVI